MNRDEKLAKLKESLPKKVINLDGQPFLDELEKRIDEFKSTLDVGIEVKNLDDLLDQLSVLQSVQQEVKNLQSAIKELKLPDKIELNGLNDLIKVINKKTDIKLEKLDPKPFIKISKSLDGLVTKIDKQKVPEPSQKPGDFVPMRRVVVINGKPMFDDSFYTGGGGGGTNIPIVNASVPVVNPDGSNVGGSSALPSTFKYNQTLGTGFGTVVQLPSNALTVGVIVQALANNVDNVYLGDINVLQTTGFELQPGQATSVAISNTNLLYINCTSGDGVSFIGS